MAAVPIGEPGRKLRKRIAANRAHLFVLVTNRDVPYIRPSRGKAVAQNLFGAIQPMV